MVPALLGWEPPPHRTTFAAALHAGSCLGIALAVDRPDARTALLAGATSVPAAVAGLLAAEAVEARLGRPRQLAALLAAAGLAMALADRRPEAVGVGPREAAAAALAQVAALAPGVSRSGAALTALRLARVRRADAERFSLLMSLPVTAGAAALTLARSDRGQLRALAGPLLAGVPAAALAGHLAVRARSRRASHALVTFALYRLALAVVLAAGASRSARPPSEESR